MRVAVTGGAGFIGSNLVHAMAVFGHELIVVDDLSAGSADNLHAAAEFVPMDILDPLFPGALAEFEPDAVVHLAAQTDVGASIADPELDWRANVEGTRAVARAAADAGARRLVAASTAAVYGEPESLPLSETAEKEPANPYGRSKLEAERVLAAEASLGGLDSASLRFANVYGPRQDWGGEGGVVATFIGHAIRREPVTVFGDGEQTRDFVFVGDVVDAIVASLGSTARLAGPGPDGPAYNVSTGTETTVNFLAGAVAAAASHHVEIRREAARQGDVARNALDPRKAERVFGWRARTGMERGIAATVAWFRDQGPV